MSQSEHTNSISNLENERQVRLEKAQKLRERGFNPYEADATRDMSLGELASQINALGEQSELVGTSKRITGRVKSIRLSGKIGFVTLEDESNTQGFQAIFKQDLLADTTETHLSFHDFKEFVDSGDYLQVTGDIGFSKRGEASIFVTHFTILTKSLRALPEDVEDTEQRYRHRYIEMKSDPQTRDMFRRKSLFWEAARQFMLNNSFLEVQAPTLEHTTGGAEATPFSTYHEALDENFYLRISSELYLKRYVVGGFEKIFDIDKNFRNEGIDAEHLQEYTQLEMYWAYASHTDVMDFGEELVKHVIEETYGTLRLTYQDRVVNWDTQWPRMSYTEFLKTYGGIDLSRYQTFEALQQFAKEQGVDVSGAPNYGRLLDEVYKKLARPFCIDPVWLTDHPVEISPLAKRNPDNPNYTLRSQLIAYGSELTNGFSELNDPVEQLQRFKEQQTLRDEGDTEAMMLDYDFIRALEYGMPPTVGFAFSERLFSILEQSSIRETAPFPMMKRKEEDFTELV